MKKNLDITGIHCASCSAIINKALSKTEGILKSNVNVSTNKATVEFDEKKIDLEKIINTIKNKGYGAKESTGEIDFNKEAEKRKKEYNEIKKRFYFSLVFAIPVFTLGMFFMENPIPYQNIILWILSTPVQFIIAYPMYQSAFAALKGKSANMDTLIVMGTSAAYFYSVFVVLSGGMHVYFEASAVLITIVLLGRLLEARAKGKTSDAIKRLIGLKPKNATVIRKGREIQIKVDDILLGDVVIVKPGEKVPTDGTLVEGHSSIDESMVT